MLKFYEYSDASSLKKFPNSKPTKLFPQYSKSIRNKYIEETENFTETKNQIYGYIPPIHYNEALNS